MLPASRGPAGKLMVVFTLFKHSPGKRAYGLDSFNLREMGQQQIILSIVEVFPLG